MRLQSVAVRACPPGPAPVEYAVAVDRYLAEACISPASRRVYRISLTSWAWPLVGRRPPRGAGRRGAMPPVLPLALLDRAGAGGMLAAAITDRAAAAGVRTVNRELSVLRSAVGWWQDQGWISADPTTGIRHVASVAAPFPPLTGDQVRDLFRVSASLREHAFWRLLYDTAEPADGILSLDAGRLDLDGNCARPGLRGRDAPLWWSPGTSQLLGWLLAGRRLGPVFLAGRRAPAGPVAADVCPFTGRARMSYRRAAEIFTSVTLPLDPAGRGWTLHQLRRARLDALAPGRVDRTPPD
jgi:hypothetical protein